MARPGIPLQVILGGGNKGHFTKEEIETRAKGEIRLGSKDFKMPKIVRENQYAKKKWKEVIGIHKDSDYVTTSDSGAIERYCMLYADIMEIEDVMKGIDEKAKAEGWDIVKTYNAKNVLKINQNLNKKIDLYIRIGSMLYLDPLSKHRNVPKKKEESKQTPLEREGFGNV